MESSLIIRTFEILDFSKKEKKNQHDVHSEKFWTEVPAVYGCRINVLMKHLKQ